jgi:hypothetical protein
MSPVPGVPAGRTAASSLAWAAAYDLAGTPATQAVRRDAGLPATGPGETPAPPGGIALARGAAVAAMTEELERGRRPPREAGPPGGFSAYA